LLRRYKPVPDRLRPHDRMIAHTGYLIFARAIAAPHPQPPFVSSSADAEDDAPAGN